MTVHWQTGPAGGGNGLATRLRSRFARLLPDRRSSVTMIVAATLPILLGATALGIDVSYWATIRIELQRTADIAALAGAAKYASTYNLGKALSTAADIAELNGLPVGTRLVNNLALTDTYGAYTGTFTFSATQTRVTATIRRSVPYLFGRILTTSSNPQVTLTALATAQVVARTASGQACVLALNGSSTGITTSDTVSISGGKNTQVSLVGCDLRSDASIEFDGSPGIGTPNIIASGSITGSYTNLCATQGCDQQIAGVPQLPDPFASKYGNQLAVPLATVAQPTGTTLTPPPAGESYQSLSFGSGTYTLDPGVYYVSGSISFNSNSVVNGSGVTIILGPQASMTVNGTISVNLTAPSTGSTAGLVFGGTTTNTISFTGNASATLGGGVYFPHATVRLNGNTSPAAQCLDIVGLNVSFGGSSSFANTGCEDLGTPAIYDFPATALLVQ